MRGIREKLNTLVYKYSLHSPLIRKLVDGYGSQVDQFLRFPSSILDQYIDPNIHDISRYSVRRLERLVSAPPLFLPKEIISNGRYYMEGEDNLLLFYENTFLCGVGFTEYGLGYLVYQIQGPGSTRGQHWHLHGVQWEALLLDLMHEWIKLQEKSELYILPGEYQAWRRYGILGEEDFQARSSRLHRLYDLNAQGFGFSKIPFNLELHPQKGTIENLERTLHNAQIDLAGPGYVWYKKLTN